MRFPFHPLFVCVAIGLSVLFLVGCEDSGSTSVKHIHVGQITQSGIFSTVSMRLANTSKNGEDVVLWITQGNARMCETIVYAEAQRTYNLRLTCPSIRKGHFNVNYNWARNETSISAIADRIRLSQ